MKTKANTPPPRARPALDGQSSVWLMVVGLVLATIAIYWPGTGNDFVNIDDSAYVTMNPRVQQGLSLENVKWAFSHIVGGNWHPITMLSHMADCQFYGLNPRGHHLTSLLFHAADTALIFLLLRRLTGTFWRSAWVAAIFAVHPLHVESVAWVAERKDVLSTFFGILTLLWYTRYAQNRAAAVAETTAPESDVRRRRSGDYWLALGFFALGLMSKPMLVTWPLVMLLLDFWPLKRLERGKVLPLVWEKIPFFALSLATCGVTMLTQRLGETVISLNREPLDLRIVNAVVSYGSYVAKTLWPNGLAFYYPLSGDIAVETVLFNGLLLAVFTFLCWRIRTNHPYALTGWLWFLGTLVPVIGLVQVGSASMADRYAYIPSIGLFIVAAWGLEALSRQWQSRTWLGVVLAVVTLLPASVATSRQIGYWHNNETLCLRALAVTKNNFTAHYVLGAGYSNDGRANDALREYAQAVMINSNSAEAHLGFGEKLYVLGDTNRGVMELKLAAKLRPSLPNDQFRLGMFLIRVGETDLGLGIYKKLIDFRTNDPASSDRLVTLLLQSENTNAAIGQLTTDVQEFPTNSDFHYRLGTLLLNTSRNGEAISQFQETIRLQPDDFPAHNDLGNLLTKTGHPDQAIAEFQQAIRLKPDSADAHYNLATVYLKQNRNDEAATEFQKAIQLSPDLAQAHYYLGVIQLKQGRIDDAIARFQETVQLKPDYALAHNKLGVALGTAGRVPEAIAEFQEAVRLKPDYGEANTNLALALKLQAGGGH